VNAVRSGDDARLMLRGYDVVAYVTQAQAVPSTLFNCREKRSVSTLARCHAEPRHDATGDRHDAAWHWAHGYASRAEFAGDAHSSSPTVGRGAIGMREGALRVACGGPDQAGAVDLLELQRAGGRRLSATEFVAGFAIGTGDRLQSPAVAGPAPAQA
jgi:hypothetical protein